MISVSRLSMFFMLPCLIFQTFSREFILGDYFFNTQHYQDLCYNKEDLSLHCNGQCILMQKVQEKEQKENNIPQATKDNKKELYYANQDYEKSLLISADKGVTHYSDFKDLGSFILIFKLFRPPIISIAT